MSDHRGIWGAREDAVWWPGAIATDQQSLQHHQQLLHQQQLAAQQQQVAQQQHEVQTSAAANHQLFSYKMASSFQHPATTLPNVSSPSSIATTGMRGYDYRLSGGMTNTNPQMSAPTQWWYSGAMDNSMQNPIQNNLQNMPSVHTPPPVSQQSQTQQQQAQVVHQQQAEAQVRQQVEVQRQQQEAHRQQAEAHRQHAEAQARHQAQQQTQVQNHHNQQNHQVQQHPQTQQQQTQTQSVQHQNHQAHHQQSIEQHSVHQHQITTVQVPTRGRMPRGKADSRPRGRMTAYAFFVQTCREEHKKKHPEENVVFAEFSKKCAERWKTMVDKEKKRFHEMAEKDKKRYDTEMQNYTPPKGEKQRGKKRKQLKDPNAPKRSLSAFFWFCNDERSKVKGANPEYGVGDIAKELGRRWAEADHEAKGRYEAMAEKDKARYEKEMTAYKKKNIPALPVAPVPEPDEEDEDEEEIDDDEDE